MSKFPSTSEGFYNAIEWAKTVPHKNGRTLYDFVNILPSSEEKLYYINKFYGESL